MTTCSINHEDHPGWYTGLFPPLWCEHIISWSTGHFGHSTWIQLTSTEHEASAGTALKGHEAVWTINCRLSTVDWFNNCVWCQAKVYQRLILSSYWDPSFRHPYPALAMINHQPFSIVVIWPPLNAMRLLTNQSFNLLTTIIAYQPPL